MEGSSSRGVRYRLKANRFHLWHRCVKKMIYLKLKRKLGMASNGFQSNGFHRVC